MRPPTEPPGFRGDLGSAPFAPAGKHSPRYPGTERPRPRQTPGKRMSRLGDVAGENRCGDRRELVAKVDDSTECAHTFPWSDQRWDRPSHGRRCGQPSEGQADPEERSSRSARVCCTQNSQPETRSSNQNDLTNKNGIPTALNERINQPSTDHQIRNCRSSCGLAPFGPLYKRALVVCDSYGSGGRWMAG